MSNIEITKESILADIEYSELREFQKTNKIKSGPSKKVVEESIKNFFDNKEDSDNKEPSADSDSVEDGEVEELKIEELVKENEELEAELDLCKKAIDSLKEENEELKEEIDELKNTPSMETPKADFVEKSDLDKLAYKLIKKSSKDDLEKFAKTYGITKEEIAKFLVEKKQGCLKLGKLI